MKKYEITKITKKDGVGRDLFRIKALRTFTAGNGKTVNCGELGGWLDGKSFLSHEGNSWVFDDSEITDGGNVSLNGVVCGNAWVTEHSIVSGDAVVSGFAWIGKNSLVSGYAKVEGQAHISDRVFIDGHAKINGKSEIRGPIKISGNSRISGNSNIE